MRATGLVTWIGFAAGATGWATGCAFDGQPTDRIDAYAAPPDAFVDADPFAPDADPNAPDARLVDASVADARIDARPVDASEPDARMCPDGYVQLEGETSWYRIEQNIASWTTAEADCEDDGPGTHLLLPDNATEYQRVNDAFFGQAWVGISDRITEGAFLAVIGVVPPYLPWNFGEPNDTFGQDCVAFGEGGKASDLACGELRGFVCECDGTAPDPASF